MECLDLKKKKSAMEVLYLKREKTLFIPESWETFIENLTF